MGKHWEKEMGVIEKFVGFPAMDFGRTSVVLFQITPLFLGGQVCGENKRI